MDADAVLESEAAPVIVKDYHGASNYDHRYRTTSLDRIYCGRQAKKTCVAGGGY